MQLIDRAGDTAATDVARHDDCVTAEWRDGGRAWATATVLLDEHGVLEWLVVRDETTGVEVHAPDRAVAADPTLGRIAAHLAAAAHFTLP